MFQGPQCFFDNFESSSYAYASVIFSKTTLCVDCHSMLYFTLCIHFKTWKLVLSGEVCWYSTVGTWTLLPSQLFPFPSPGSGAELLQKWVRNPHVTVRSDPTEFWREGRSLYCTTLYKCTKYIVNWLDEKKYLETDFFTPPQPLPPLSWKLFSITLV